jgi:hypothetical protein
MYVGIIQHLAPNHGHMKSIILSIRQSYVLLYSSVCADNDMEMMDETR